MGMDSLCEPNELASVGAADAFLGLVLNSKIAARLTI